ncbi:hypothetical protein, partial [Paenibacillus sp. PDC88]|uniref:hypothetical protein n=1 Tax=Paenibacillus sp. PDC88 TaxID=1884375 RepID=UPI001C435251
RGGHPCLWLTVPTAKPVADFHRRAIAHAGRTKKSRCVQRLIIIIFKNEIRHNSLYTNARE